MPSLKKEPVVRITRAREKKRNDGAPTQKSMSSSTKSKSAMEHYENELRAEKSKDTTATDALNILEEGKVSSSTKSTKSPSKTKPPQRKSKVATIAIGAPHNNKSSSAAAKAKSPAAKESQDISTPTPTITPSPDQVVVDLIDATCHEILFLKSNDPESPIAPYKLYATHAERLEHYMGQLSLLEEKGDDDFNDEEPLLSDINIRYRLTMAKLVIETCARMAYPDVFVDTSQTQQPKSDLPPLIEIDDTRWNELRQEVGKLHDKMKLLGEEGENIDESFESLNCQMEAFAELAKLRSQLLEVYTEINEGENDAGKKQKSASQFSYVGDFIEGYKMTSNVIIGKLQNIQQTSTPPDLFVPQQMLSFKRCSTIDRVKDSVIALIEGIDDMVTKTMFPLSQFQVEFLGLMRKWEKSFLPTPALFQQTAYFKHPESSTPAKATASSDTPASPSATSDVASRDDKPKKTAKTAPPPPPPKDEFTYYSDDSFKIKRTKSKKRSQKQAEKKKVQYTYDSDSDSADSSDGGAPPVRTQKRPKRIPYSKEEKDTLLKGVERFGRGQWEHIRSYYSSVFEVNNRSNVNLKDLYRTLTKDA